MNGRKIPRRVLASDSTYGLARAEFEGSRNGRRFFGNVNQVARAMPPGRFFATHRDETVHAITGNLFAQRIETVLPELLSLRADRVARGLPAGSGKGAGAPR